MNKVNEVNEDNVVNNEKEDRLSWGNFLLPLNSWHILYDMYDEARIDISEKIKKYFPNLDLLVFAASITVLSDSKHSGVWYNFNNFCSHEKKDFDFESYLQYLNSKEFDGKIENWFDIINLENVCKYTQTDINQCSYENLEFLLGSIKYLKQQTIEQQ